MSESYKEAQRVLREMRRAQEAFRVARKAQQSVQEVGQMAQEVGREVREAQGAVQEVRQVQEALKEVQRAQEAVQEVQMAREAGREARDAQQAVKEARQAQEALKEVRRAREEVEAVRGEYLGRSAELTKIKRSISSLPVEQRKDVGSAANRVSRDLEEAINARVDELTTIEREAQLRFEAVDVTLPGVPYPKGSLHPSMRVIDEVVDLFVGLGYRVAEGPEVETDYYNFTALNIPPGHPARGMQDTFFLDDGLVLRTHTSPVQIRTMLGQEPPVYIVCPGRTYRRDSDPTHTPMFNQIEGLAVDKGLTLGHLKGTLAAMARHVFGEDVKVRLRPSYFQFVEPGVELDVSCFLCGGSDPSCKVCKGAGWIEMLGAGMVDPAVLSEVGYDPEEYTGFAFGMGPDRMAMVKYDIPDLRLFFEGDLRFLQQF